MPTREERIANLEAAYAKEERIKALESAWAAKQADPTTLAEKAETAARGFASGMTLGISEPVISGAKAAVDVGSDYVFGTGNEEVDKGIIDRLSGAYDKDVTERRKLQEQLPVLDTASNIAGAVLPAFVSGGQSLAARVLIKGGGNVALKGGKAARGLVQAIPYFDKAAKIPVIGSAARVAAGAAEGAGATLASEVLRRGTGKATGFIKDTDQEVPLAETVAFGGKVGAGISAIPEVVRGVKAVGKQALNVLGGASIKDIDAYLANPNRIRNAPDLETIKSDIDEVVGGLQKAVDEGKMSVEQASEKVKQAKQLLKDHVSENKEILRQQKWDIAEAKREASAIADDAVQRTIEPIKNVRPPTRLADDVLDSVSDLKTKVVEGSGEAYDILANTKGKTDLRGVDKVAKKVQEGLKVGGKDGAVVTSTAKASFDAIQRFRDSLKELPKKISFSDAKKLVQQLDQEINFISRAGEFSDDASEALLGVRRAIDEKLKDVPGYAEKMKEVAENTRLLKDASRSFGERGAAVSKLSNIDSNSNITHRDVLARLGGKTGRDFQSPMQEYMSTKALGRDPRALSLMTSELPEVQAARKAEMELARSRRPEFGQERLRFAEESSPQAMALQQAEKEQAVAMQKLSQAEEAMSPFTRLGPSSTQNVIRNMMGNNQSIEFKRALEKLSKISDKDFVALIEDMGAAKRLSGGATNGSRNVNLWALLASGVFTLGVTGDPYQAIVAAGAGAGFGGIVDKLGPTMSKKLIDGYVKMKGVPTIQKIDRAFQGVSPAVREELKADLVRALNTYRQGGSVFVSPEEREQVKLDIKSSGLSNVEKAKMVNSLNKDGALDEDDLIKMSSGAQTKPDSTAGKFLEERVE